MTRIEGSQFVQRDLVVAEDANVRAKFAEVLDEVVGKGVVVIYQYKHSKDLSSPQSSFFEPRRSLRKKPFKIFAFFALLAVNFSVLSVYSVVSFLLSIIFSE